MSKTTKPPRITSVFDYGTGDRERRKAGNLAVKPAYFVKEWEGIVAAFESAGVKRDDIFAAGAERGYKPPPHSMAAQAMRGVRVLGVVSEAEQQKKLGALIRRRDELLELANRHLEDPRMFLPKARLDANLAQTAAATRERTKYSAAMKAKWLEIAREEGIADLSVRDAAKQIRQRLELDIASESSIRATVQGFRSSKQ